ncbi:MAG: hypothetical protein IH586_11095 [Anaerolineaceae bacterium]|nr:hypothetical protein [Anaerolineaceae bacterium]
MTAFQIGVMLDSFNVGLTEGIRSNGLVVSALCGDLGGHGFALAEENGWMRSQV